MKYVTSYDILSLVSLGKRTQILTTAGEHLKQSQTSALVHVIKHRGRPLRQHFDNVRSVRDEKNSGGQKIKHITREK